jgi:lipopolysaccharide transport system ATP-binding protein
MAQTAIKIEGLSKLYKIGQAKSGSLREAFTRKFAITKKDQQEANHYWALKDVSFQIKSGEAVGIIGKNGAGKSTLLKILSRITEPTKGRIEINGRVASLLEVGTGFHPELSGRENIYLNGTILGMTRREIKAKFDEIVNFSGVEKFIDTPVKHYSSGMYVRLAFAVAAHLDPEILIIDEVLAVGDAEFQKKCLGKMSEVTGQGRTVIFVSHQMDAVLRLCQHAVLLDKGRVICNDVTDKVVNLYLATNHKATSVKQWSKNEAPGNHIVRLLEVKVHAENGVAAENLNITKPIYLSMTYEVLEDGHYLVPGFNFFNQSGVNLFDTHDTSKENKYPKYKGLHTSTVVIPGNFLSEGVILVGAACLTPDPFFVHFHSKDVVAFNVVDNLLSGSARGEYVGHFPGLIRPLLHWRRTSDSILL